MSDLPVHYNATLDSSPVVLLRWGGFQSNKLHSVTEREGVKERGMREGERESE